MIHAEDDIINVSSIRKNRIAYPRKENNCDDDSSMVILYEEHLGDTIISGNTDLIINIIMESRDLILSYLHIGINTGNEKYSI